MAGSDTLTLPPGLLSPEAFQFAAPPRLTAPAVPAPSPGPPRWQQPPGLMSPMAFAYPLPPQALTPPQQAGQAEGFLAFFP